MDADLTARADERLEAELAETGRRDPREYYRDRLRELKQADTDGYQKAVAYYRDVLIPAVASGDASPLAAWTEYGRRLATGLAAGQTVRIDASGLSQPARESDTDGFLLHLPDNVRVKAIVVGLPAELSAAQRATYDALVLGRQKLRDP